MDREKREKVAQGLAERKKALRQRQETISSDKTFKEARKQIEADYGVDVIGEVSELVEASVELVSLLENYLNLDIKDNRG